MINSTESTECTKLVRNGRVNLRVKAPGERTEWISFRTEQQADIAIDFIEARHGHPRPDPVITVGDFADLWREHHLIKTCAYETNITYSQRLDSHVLPRFASRRLASLSTQDIQSFFEDVSRSAGARTAVNTVEVLSSMLSCAVRWHFLVDNPAKGVLR